MKKILFFTAPWCSGCQSLKPHLEKVQGKIEVEIIDVEDRGEEAAAYGVSSLPTLFFIQDEALVRHRSGASESIVKEIYVFAGER